MTNYFIPYQERRRSLDSFYSFLSDIVDSPEPEIDPVAARSEAFKAFEWLLSEEGGRFSDVELRGTDGVTVRAHRIILATTNTFFRTMLSGRFSESESGIIQTDFPSLTLKVLVKFLYTREFSPSDVEADTESMSVLDLVKTLFSIAAAASYYDVPDILPEIKTYLEKHGHQACYVLEASRLETCPVIDEWVERSTLKIIRDPLDYLTGPGLLSLSKPTLEELVRQPKIRATEFQLFKIVRDWVEGGYVHLTNGDAMADFPGGRKEAGKALLAHINLKRIDPESLRGEVLDSCLIANDKLSEALQDHALDESLYLWHDRKRFHFGMEWTIWEGHYSDDASMDKLPNQRRVFHGVRRMRTGRNQWIIQLTCNGAPSMGVGFIKYEIYITDRKKLLLEPFAWYKDTGDRVPTWYSSASPPTSESNVSSSFGKKGDVIHFILDKDEDEGTIKWTASINGGPFQDIWGDIDGESPLHNLGDYYLLPAILLRNPEEACIVRQF